MKLSFPGQCLLLTNPRWKTKSSLRFMRLSNSSPPRHSLVWPTLKKAIPPSAPPVRQGKYWPVPLQRSLYGELWGRRLAEHWWMLIRASQPVVKTTCQSYHGAPFISVSTFWLHNPFHKPLWVIKDSLALECQWPHEEGVQTNELENIS